MKDRLIKHLQVLEEARVSIVRELLYWEIGKNDEFYLDGRWCKLVRGWKERTLYHISYTFNGHNYKTTKHNPRFLVRITFDSKDEE
ncbi:TPA: hypothetical protein JG872_000341 [Enterobacter hormaechei subsp. xiangfangensis]|uniref:hypothetical protein n=1 Tax=Enterobacter hormaechei TaxID=158836 RepID=UPI001C181C62|nr:hypothetical protein [Enterobacter hormaechei subsp. xiangfangensis]HAV1860647.1 hypothetical protein [Enterobacter hormaechei subsp. xiangfangensis]